MNVLIIGTGLLGASLGQALVKAGHTVYLEDSSPLNLRLAIEYGAGQSALGVAPDLIELVVVSVPPDHAAATVADSLRRFPLATVTDVASVKASVLAEVRALVDAGAVERYVGSHPMAGREKSGPASARADLFFSRPWIIVPHSGKQDEHVKKLRALAADVNAIPYVLEPEEHDRAVALVSHLPQVISSVLAGQLSDSNLDRLSLAGQGLRDTVRIAASDPELWIQILSRNSSAIVPMLTELTNQLQRVATALQHMDEPGALRILHEVLLAGNLGVARIPGKHGGKSVDYSTVTVLIDDRPGQLAKLLTEVGEIGVNLEDMQLSHSPGAPIGIVELSVLPEHSEHLVGSLQTRGWRLA